MVGALLNFFKWRAITSTVCGPIVDFSNSTNDVNHWIELKIVSSNEQLRIADIVILNFHIKVEV